MMQINFACRIIKEKQFFFLQIRFLQGNISTTECGCLRYDDHRLIVHLNVRNFSTTLNTLYFLRRGEDASGQVISANLYITHIQILSEQLFPNVGSQRLTRTRNLFTQH